MKKILLVDDQPNFLKMISIKLKKNNFTVITAENGSIAIEKAANEIPDIIIIDIMMPVMDGFSAVKKIKKNPDTKDIPVIFLSAKGQENDKIMAKELGAVDFIAKPFSPGKLVEKIQEHIS